MEALEVEANAYRPILPLALTDQELLQANQNTYWPIPGYF